MKVYIKSTTDMYKTDLQFYFLDILFLSTFLTLLQFHKIPWSFA